MLRENPCVRWEIQVKGAGLTPYSWSGRLHTDGHKAQHSSIREFLCSEAVFALGVNVVRDVYYRRYPTKERCSVALRIAPTFIRFGSFEIFKVADENTSWQGPSYGHDEIRGQMMDYWQCVGFCHGVLNTDNMSILGLTLDYGFMDRFDPDFICNASDNSGCYTYQALDPEMPPGRAEAVLDEYLPLYNTFYLGNMRRKLGLLRKEEPEDEMLITELLQTMHNTGRERDSLHTQIKFVTYGCLADVVAGVAKCLCFWLQYELTMVLNLAQSNPSLFQMVSERRMVTMKLGVAQRSCWRSSHPALCCDWCSKSLAEEVEGQRAVQALQEERVKVMNGTNPQYVLRNYIAQNTIEAAENGDFSEVRERWSSRWQERQHPKCVFPMTASPQVWANEICVT
uniref:Selenoprotein O n=1 Tax=Oncorhynchus kisutch TaxID=8019 RepID=A0A8C7IBG5_ONCKI